MGHLLVFLFASFIGLKDSAANMQTHTIYNPQIDYEIKDTGWSLYGCKTENIEIKGLDPITNLPRTIKVILYKAYTNNLNRAVIVLPPTGGINLIDRGYSNKLCSAGLTVALLQDWEHRDYMDLDFKMHDIGALRYISATRHTLEFLKSRDFNSVGLLGTSIGAIGGALAFGVEERIKAAAFIVGSARFADVVGTSTEKETSDLRESRMKKFDIKTQDEYTAAAKKEVMMDPAKYLTTVGDRSSLVVTADKDVTIPTEYQLELVEILKPKQHIKLQGSHIQAIKSAFWRHSSDIVNFFKSSL